MNDVKWHPGTLLQISGGYWQTCALHAGVKLDVFTVLGKDGKGSKDIATELNADERALNMLLNALAAMKLLEKEGDRYRNTPASLQFLSKSSPQYIGHMILHHQQLMASWSMLDEGVRTGSPVRSRAFRDDASWRENFLMGMFNIAMQTAPGIVREIDITDRTHLLDLGGGPGTYAIHFCKQNPKLKATVYDLPTTRRFAEKTIESFGMSDRIQFLDVDYLEEGIEGTYDAAWLSHILHGEGPDGCADILQKTVSALAPGGIILIHDFILNDTMDGPLFPALFSLNMLLGTDGGQSYSEAQIRSMLSNAGIKDIKRIKITSPNDSGVLSGIK
jgi:predicted O-methyltransferase YrrM